VAEIESIAQQIKQNYAECEVLVVGYTDTDPLKRAKGTWKDNWNLGVQRALAVLRILQAEGVPGAKLSAISRGPFHPKRTKAESRRVEIVLRLPAGADTYE
jgi:flagellar motor protein MotB